MNKVRLCMLVIVLMSISAGCKTHFHLPILLDGPNTADQAFDVNVVVAPNGMKHFFWVDCANYDGHCYFSHKRTYTGDTLSSFVQIINTELDREPYVPFYRFPDSAVAEDGTVYLVWHYRDHDGQYFDCWNYIIPTGGFHDGECHKLQDVGQYSPSISYPQVIARDDVSYAVYEVDNGSSSTLYYRQLNPLNASHGMVTEYESGSSANPSLALSSYMSGEDTVYVLHVAWANHGGNADSETVYNDNYGTIGNMDNLHYSPEIGVRSAPVIVTTSGTEKKVHITYRKGAEGSPGTLKVMYCYLPDCPTMYSYADGLLDTAEDWVIFGRPDMVALSNDSVLISFLGGNETTRGTTSFQEVFTLIYEGGITSLPIAPNRVTANNLEESDPRIALTYPEESIPGITLAWRLNPDPGVFSDVYIADNYTGSIRTVFTSPEAVLGGYYDIAACGENIGGIFMDRATALNPLHSPWVSFNDYGRFLPLIKKP